MINCDAASVAVVQTTQTSVWERQSGCLNQAGIQIATAVSCATSRVRPAALIVSFTVALHFEHTAFTSASGNSSCDAVSMRLPQTCRRILYCEKASEMAHLTRFHES